MIVLLIGLSCSTGSAFEVADLTHNAKGTLYISDTFSEFIARVDPDRQHRIAMVAKGRSAASRTGLRFIRRRTVGSVWEGEPEQPMRGPSAERSGLRIGLVEMNPVIVS